VETLTIDDDDRPNFYIETFGYEIGGKMEFEVKDFMLMVPHDYNAAPDHSFNLAFVFQRSSSDVVSRDDLSRNTCFHESKMNDDDEIIMMSSRTQWADTKIEKTIKIPGYYHLFFSNCEPNTHTSFTMVLSQYNVDRSGSKKLSLCRQGLSPNMVFLHLLSLRGAARRVALRSVCRTGSDPQYSLADDGGVGVEDIDSVL
jgi:hypothetical protein